ncbi:hypothetical protein Pint_30983 [Pistacia integerrima]|uniref:Uncharacterized protein n=1 Tax=Pistacia integerrima TaxID=434235 RepID=A0ACC0XKV5_9ROSI|nr:hypothetical protein Pint_30983 [Pistacia integerrima]
MSPKLAKVADLRRYVGVSNACYALRKIQNKYSKRERSNVPAWEKKFCLEVGSIPWNKLVQFKMFIYEFDRVVEWNDSATEEAFRKAKFRYWLEING